MVQNTVNQGDIRVLGNPVSGPSGSRFTVRVTLENTGTRSGTFEVRGDTIGPPTQNLSPESGFNDVDGRWGVVNLGGGDSRTLTFETAALTQAGSYDVFILAAIGDDLQDTVRESNVIEIFVPAGGQLSDVRVS